MTALLQPMLNTVRLKSPFSKQRDHMAEPQGVSNFEDYIFSFGIMATFAPDLCNISKNYHYSKKTTFIDTAAAERIKWMNKVRNNS